MVRISDVRMSGTAFETVVLHASPETALGGYISHVRDGDMITLNVNEQTLSVDVSDKELKNRKVLWTPPMPPARGTLAALILHPQSMVELILAVGIGIVPFL